jgi:YVTN family beta-propeller protein
MARRACWTGKATPRNPIVLVLVLLGLLVSGLFTVAWPSAARAAGPPAAAAPAASVVPAAPVAVSARPGATVKAGTNLLLNPQATAGDAAQVWDAVTIPGWQVQAGLPTVVRYGTSGFPKAAGTWPASRGDLFAGGAGGTASLVQVVRFGSVAPGTRFTAAAWLGGTKTSDADLKVRFLDADGRVKSTATVGPVGRQTRPVLAYRTVTGTIPAGATQAKVTLILATTLTDDNGPDAPEVGNSYATAAGLRLAVSYPVAKPAALTPPRPQVPGYQHVFLFYFENEDVKDIIGNTKQAPYFNSLLKQGTSLTSFYAEAHPSDANYVAFAAGATDGLPPTDPEEENPLYTVDAPNIGDLVDAQGESWKAYTQSADGPCDDTVHGYYWNDDQPMLYFKDVRDNPAYCASHVVPLEELPGDLRSPATTPNFAWISPDDCSDMEGCGIAAGDAFLKTELSQIMNSPAWRTQRSLAIITFDEDAQDGQHPAQRIPTIVLGSQGVKRGATDATRFTHYSMLRTIEAALGTGTLTANDRYAPAFNQVFDTERAVACASPVPVSTSAAQPAKPGPAAAAVTEPARTAAPAAAAPFLASAAAARQPVGWVANYAGNTVTPVNLVTRKAGPAIPAGPRPRAIVAAPDGKTVYVADSGSDTVTPINAATGRPGPPVRVGLAPWALAVTPDGKTLYVADSGSGTVTPVTTASVAGQAGKAGTPIPVGRDPRAIALTPDGATAYVLNWLSGTVTPIATATGLPGATVGVGPFPVAFAFSPGARTLYVASFGGDTVTPINTATNRPARARPAGYAPDALAATSTGLYAVDGNSDEVTRLGGPTVTRVGYSPAAIAVSGSTAYVVNTIDSTVTPLNTRTGKAAKPFSVGAFTYPTAIALSGATAIVVEPYGYSVDLIDTRTNHAYPPIPVGAFPDAVTVTG